MAYHALTRGLIVNEIIRRADPKHRSIGKFVAEEIAKPLGIDFYIGAPNDKQINDRLANRIITDRRTLPSLSSLITIIIAPAQHHTIMA